MEADLYHPTACDRTEPFPYAELRKAVDSLRERHVTFVGGFDEETLFWALHEALANYNSAAKANGRKEV